MKPGTPAFRRSWWGYNTRDVDLFLQETADERRRLEDGLARVETLMAEWQCGPEAILAAAHREAAEIRANAEREARNSSKPPEGRLQVIPVNVPRRELPVNSEATLPPFGTSGGFMLEEVITDKTGPSFDAMSVTGTTSISAIDALERSRLQRRGRTRRIAILVAACASVVTMIAFAYNDQGAKTASRDVGTQATVSPLRGRGQTATQTAARRGSTATTSVAPPPAPPSPSGTPAKGLMLTISAVKPCWIRTVVDGTQQMERVLQPDETVMLHATAEALLRVGDAGAVSLLINNRRAKPLGRNGEVVTRLITHANYSSLLQTEF